MRAALLVCLILQSAPTPPDKSAERTLASAVSEDRLRRSVRELVAFGPRMGGTPSGDRASAYLAEYFRRLGLATETFTDAATLTHWEERWRVELASGEAIESAWPYGFSPSIPEARTGRLVMAATLAAPDPAWRGAVVYTPSQIGRGYDAVAASQFRPLAILTSAPNAAPRYLDWARIGELPARSDNPVPVFGVSYLDGRTLASAAGRGDVRVSLVSHLQQGSPRTVVATLAGRESGKYYLVCAHGDSDSGGPGADDNASGVATVMETARVFAELTASGVIPKPRYPIAFAIWGSEYKSTKAYIERQGAGLANLLAVLNFDETGTGAERDAIYFESNDVPWNQTLLRTLEAVAGDYAWQPGFWTEYTTNPSQGGTDSYAFLPRLYKGEGYTPLQIPATTIYTAAWDHLARVAQTRGWESRGTPSPSTLEIDYSLYYHSAGDTPENTTEREPQNMVKAVKAAAIGLLRLDR
jgi:Peptidase family M28